MLIVLTHNEFHGPGCVRCVPDVTYPTRAALRHGDGLQIQACLQRSGAAYRAAIGFVRAKLSQAAHGHDEVSFAPHALRKYTKPRVKTSKICSLFLQKRAWTLWFVVLNH
jgi:RNA 3'-terminal phosphate cyclase